MNAEDRIPGLFVLSSVLGPYIPCRGINVKEKACDEKKQAVSSRRIITLTEVFRLLANNFQTNRLGSLLLDEFVVEDGTTNDSLISVLARVVVLFPDRSTKPKYRCSRDFHPRIKHYRIQAVICEFKCDRPVPVSRVDQHCRLYNCKPDSGQSAATLDEEPEILTDGYSLVSVPQDKTAGLEQEGFVVFDANFLVIRQCVLFYVNRLTGNGPQEVMTECQEDTGGADAFFGIRAYYKPAFFDRFSEIFGG